MTAAAFSGDYCDLKFVKTRKVAQITIEIPIEQAAAFVASFGAPDPSQGVPVALARLKPGSSAGSEQRTSNSEVAGSNPAPATKDRKAWADLPCSQQAAIRCGEVAFQKFMSEYNVGQVHNAETCAQAVRCVTGCDSRSELNEYGPKQDIWREIEAEYQTWLRVPV